MGFLVASLCVVLSLVLGARGQQCTQLQLNQNIEALIVSALTLGDSGSAPAIDVIDSQTVCLAAGSTRDLYRYASVVVSFNCSGSLPPGNPLGISSCDGELTVQFDFECTAGPQWVNALTLGGDNVFNPSDANLSTSLRTDCSFCLDPAQGPVFQFAVDVVTHCGGKLIFLLATYMFIAHSRVCVFLFFFILIFNMVKPSTNVLISEGLSFFRGAPLDTFTRLTKNSSRMEKFNVVIDDHSITHTIECDAGCIGPLEQCTGILPVQCCNFYQDNECAIECDAAQGFEPDGIDCSKLCVMYLHM